MRRMNEQEDKYDVDSDWVMPQITDLVPDGGSLDQQSEQQRVHLRGLDGQRAASRSRDSCVPQEVTVLLTQTHMGQAPQPSGSQPTAGPEFPENLTPAELAILDSRVTQRDGCT